MQTATIKEIIPHPEPKSDVNPEIDALITMRILAFYKHLVDSGSIKPLSTEGPSIN